MDIGQLVIVPFGPQTVQAVVLEHIDKPSVSYAKEVLSIIDPVPVLTPAQIALANSLSATTLSPLAAIVGLFLPTGLAQQADAQYSIVLPEALTTADISSSPEIGPVQKRLLKLLAERGPLRGRQIDRAMPQTDWRRAARSLIRRGMLNSRSILPPVSVRAKFVRTAQLAVPPEEAEAAFSSLGNRSTQVRRQNVLRYLMKRPDAVNVSWVYAETGCNAADLQELAERQLITLQETEIWRDPVEKVERRGPVHPEVLLSDEQQAAWERIRAGLDEAANGRATRPFLLQGVTGSGKTELYLRAACEAIDRGRQAIILVPEISLTAQTVYKFAARFPGETGLLHSKLSEGERYDTWRRARAGLLKVIIGPRSALFAPLPDVGLIVLDECHDTSYYQAEPPFYNAVSCAQEYARISSAVCILGSATPAIVQRYQAEVGRSIPLKLTQRLGAGEAGGPAQSLDLPPVHVVDMREELKAGNRGILSRELHQALEAVLEQGEQAILFMNRRGNATYVFCRNCGYGMKCPRCDTPLTQHITAGERLLCHHCGFQRQMPKKCPQCGSTNMRAYGLGTEKVEAEVQRNFPKARTLRWDWETTREKDSQDVILGHFTAGRADVLIGTQMLAKGLDLPRVTLVGIVLADVGLYLPDPYAAERVFQVLTQVAGRAGRTSLGGRAVLQTFAPEHYVIQAAAAHDVNGFYLKESAQRRRLGYPPFSSLMRLEFRGYDADQAERAANGLAAKLRRQVDSDKRRSVNIIGPAPCFFSKLDGKYRWQIILRGADLNDLIRGRLGPDWRIEAEPASLL